MAFIRVKYIRSSSGEKQFGPYSYLVESYREGGKVKQRHLGYLGPGDLRGQDVSTYTRQLGTTTQKVNKGLPPKTTGYHPYLGEDGNTYDFEVRDGEIHVVGVRDSKTNKEMNIPIKEIKKRWGWEKVKLREDRVPKPGTTKTLSDKQFLKVVDQEYKKSDKLGDMVHVPDLTKQIQKETGLSKEEVHKRLYEAYIDKKIDLQPGKGKGSLKGPDDATFQYMQPRKLGTTNQEVQKFNMMTITEFQEHIDDYEYDKDTQELNRIKRVVKSEKINNQATKLYYIDASLRRIKEEED